MLIPLSLLILLPPMKKLAWIIAAFLKATQIEIPLPTEKRIFTVLRSPHVNKKGREQFQLCAYKRLLDIYSSNSKTVDALMKLELPSGVEVEIKV